MRKATIRRQYSTKLRKNIHHLKVQGCTTALLFNDDELLALVDVIHEALSDRS